MRYEAEPQSREGIRELANILRKAFGCENDLYFPIVELLDILAEKDEGFSYEIVEDDAFPKNIHADTDITTGHIRIKQSVYDGACSGRGRDRMTIAHEIGHYFLLCICGFKLQRNYDEKGKIQTCMDPEWQAKCFAGELLVPAHLVKDMSPREIAKKCGVSKDAAKYQYKKIHKLTK